MSAQIFDLARYQSKKALKPETLEQQAVSIINVALADHLDPTSAGYVATVGELTYTGPPLYVADTAPCELNPQDPA